jgi:predicted O-methyltransferase YrrM
MYGPFTIAIKYIKYYLTAANGKGHGVHSPFVYTFIEQVLNNKCKPPYFNTIEQRRNWLLKNNTQLQVTDFGAQSAVIKKNTRKISAIAASSLKPKKYARLLHNIVAYYKPQNLVELGTSFGITTAYLAQANTQAQLTTFEGDENIAAIAQQTLQQQQNTKIVIGNFANTLPQTLPTLPLIDFAFFDGNHQKIPTLAYFEAVLQKAQPHTFFIFDDIHWSAEMESAWSEIKNLTSVTLSIDLFFVGIVFINPNFKVKQHFLIRY